MCTLEKTGSKQLGFEAEQSRKGNKPEHLIFLKRKEGARSNSKHGGLEAAVEGKGNEPESFNIPKARSRTTKQQQATGLGRGRYEEKK